MAVTTGGGRRQIATALNLSAIVDYATGAHRRAAAVLLAAALLSFLPGFFAIPPIDRDEARFAQATKQMVESGDYVDIRFQDEVRYKKPVGIYWLQAGVVKTASVLGLRDALTTIWLYRVPSLIGAIGAVLLTYWTALAFVSRRAALLAGLMMASSMMLGVERLIAKTDAVLLLTVVAAMGALARAYLPEQRERLDAISAWKVAALFWSALAAGVLLKGPLILMLVALTVITLVAVDRSWRWLAALKPLAGVLWFTLLVLPWFSRSSPVPATHSGGVGGTGSADQGREQPGIPRVAARLLFPAVLGDILARGHARGVGCAGGLGGSTRAGHQVLARLAASVLDRIRARGDQAPPLRAAALSRGRDPDRRGRRCPAVVACAEAGWGDDLVVRGCGAGGHHGHCGAHHDRPAVRAVGMADDRRRRRPGLSCLAFLRQRRRRAVAAARGCGRDPHRDCDLQLDPAVARPTVSERCARARPARQRVPAAGCGRGRLPGAEPGVPRRHLDPAHRRGRRGRVLARRGLPLRLRRSPPGKELRSARRGDRLALHRAEPRIEGINFSTGSPVTIAVYRSGAPS